MAPGGLSVMEPTSGAIRPASVRSNVVLPAPLTPTSPTTSPGATIRSRSLNKVRSAWPCPKPLATSVALIRPPIVPPALWPSVRGSVHYGPAQTRADNRRSGRRGGAKLGGLPGTSPSKRKRCGSTTGVARCVCSLTIRSEVRSLLEHADPGSLAAVLVPDHDEESTAALVGVDVACTGCPTYGTKDNGSVFDDVRSHADRAARGWLRDSIDRVVAGALSWRLVGRYGRPKHRHAG